MSDKSEETPQDNPGPRSAGAAARRARRIGGSSSSPRPTPKPTPDVAPPADSPGAKKISTAKPAAKSPATKSPVAKGPATKSPTARAAATARTAKTTQAAAAKRSAREDDTDATEDAPTVVTQVPAWLLWLPAAVLGVLALVFAVAIGVTAHGVWYAEPSANTARDEVLAAAKTCVAATNSYKYTSIAQDERNGLKCTTGAWTTNYRKAMEQVLIPNSKTLKSTQVAQINAAGVQSVESNGTVWKLLVFGQVSVTSVNQKTPRPDPFSAVVTMRKDGGKWKVADIDQVLKPIKSS